MRRKQNLIVAMVTATCLVMSTFITAQAAALSANQDVTAHNNEVIQVLHKEQAFEAVTLGKNVVEAGELKHASRSHRYAVLRFP